jgi:hypothetical protein
MSSPNPDPAGYTCTYDNPTIRSRLREVAGRGDWIFLEDVGLPRTGLFS